MWSDTRVEHRDHDLFARGSLPCGFGADGAETPLFVRAGVVGGGEQEEPMVYARGFFEMASTVPGGTAVLPSSGITCNVPAYATTATRSEGAVLVEGEAAGLPRGMPVSSRAVRRARTDLTVVAPVRQRTGHCRVGAAATVLYMILVLLGIAAGVAIGIGKLPPLTYWQIRSQTPQWRLVMTVSTRSCEHPESTRRTRRSSWHVPSQLP